MDNTYFIHVFDIDWDTYDEDSGKNLDPKKLGLPSEVVICDLSEDMYHEIVDNATGVADYLTGTYNVCVLGFSTDEYTADNPHVEEIIHRIGEEYAI